MKRTAIGCVVLSLCLVCFPASSQEGGKGKGKFKGRGQPAPSETYSGPRWEYSVLSGPEVARVASDLRSGLSKLGDEGWELIAIEPMTGASQLYFKRQKHAARPSATVWGHLPEGKEVTRIIRLKHATATAIVETLAQLYRERGVGLAVDARTNSIILVGSEERMLDLLKLAAELDGEEAYKEKPKVEKPGGR